MARCFRGGKNAMPIRFRLPGSVPCTHFLHYRRSKVWFLSDRDHSPVWKRSCTNACSSPQSLSTNRAGPSKSAQGWKKQKEGNEGSGTAATHGQKAKTEKVTEIGEARNK